MDGQSLPAASQRHYVLVFNKEPITCDRLAIIVCVYVGDARESYP